MAEIKTHNVMLEAVSPKGVHIRLRPLTGEDWDLLLKWNNDPEVLYYAEEDDISGYTLEGVMNLYSSVCAQAYCFIIKADGTPIGECWLQEMNIDQVLAMYPGLDVRRIDLAIGEKGHWDKGIGTTVIRMLTGFGFNQEGADLIYEPGIADYNIRSLKAFQKVGYATVAEIPQEPGRKAKTLYDLMLTREQFRTQDKS